MTNFPFSPYKETIGIDPETKQEIISPFRTRTPRIGNLYRS